jgi:phage shock protein PspC (stress-responsive transcriptional regulator)
VYVIFWIGIPTKDFDPNLRKKLYRDKENGIFGGVAQGLSNYLKIDVTVIRVFFVISLFFGGAGLLFYVLLWIFTKEAKTIGEKMNMSGFNVNLSNIEEFIKKKTNNLNSPESTLTKIFLFPFRLLAPLITAFLKIGLFILKTVFFIFSSIFTILVTVLIVILSTILFNEISQNQDPEYYEIINTIPDYFIIFSILFLVVNLIISFIVSFYILFNKKSNPYFFMFMIFLWIAFLIFIIISVPNLVLNLQDLDHLPLWKWSWSGYDNFYYEYKWMN